MGNKRGLDCSILFSILIDIMNVSVLDFHAQIQKIRVFNPQYNLQPAGIMGGLAALGTPNEPL